MVPQVAAAVAGLGLRLDGGLDRRMDTVRERLAAAGPVPDLRRPDRLIRDRQRCDRPAGAAAPAAGRRRVGPRQPSGWRPRPAGSRPASPLQLLARGWSLTWREDDAAARRCEVWRVSSRGTRLGHPTGRRPDLEHRRDPDGDTSHVTLTTVHALRNHLPCRQTAEPAQPPRSRRRWPSSVDLVARLESGRLGLSESIAAYERGVALLRRLHEELAQAEERVSVLVRHRRRRAGRSCADHEAGGRPPPERRPRSRDRSRGQDAAAPGHCPGWTRRRTRHKLQGIEHVVREAGVGFPCGPPMQGLRMASCPADAAGARGAMTASTSARMCPTRLRRVQEFIEPLLAAADDSLSRDGIRPTAAGGPPACPARPGQAAAAGAGPLGGPGLRRRSARGRGWQAAAPAAMAVEMIHAYSLVHDDLPAMDDDDLRRGRPTCHRAFDEATAILCGDALQPLAFETLAQRTSASPLRARPAWCSPGLPGAEALVGGQSDDLACRTGLD